MSKSKIAVCALSGAAAFVLLKSLPAAVNVQSHQGPPSTQSEGDARAHRAAKERDDAATPIVDFLNPAGVEPGDSEGRKSKNARHDRQALVKSDPHPEVGETISEPEWQAGLSDIPADKSDLVIEGEVVDSKAFLSGDKTGVYSEFTVRVSRVLKVAPDLSVKPDDTVVAERDGGRVRYPSGKVIRYRIEGQGAPSQGKTHLFFLARAGGGSYRLLTAYGSQGGKVFALDGSRINSRGQGNWVFDKHNGRDFDSFMQEVVKELDRPLQIGGGRP